MLGSDSNRRPHLWHTRPMRRSSGGLMAALAISIALSPVAAATVVVAGSGQAPRVVTVKSVGRLKIGRANEAAVRKVFGTPATVWHVTQSGFSRDYPFFAEAGVAIFVYPCRGRSEPCTYFAFDSRSRLSGFSTTDTAFRTAGGTSIGTPLSQALRNDKATWHGTQVQVVALDYSAPSSSSSFKAYVDSKTLKVSGLFVSRSNVIGDGS